jgi:SEC-C motif-containing protein
MKNNKENKHQPCPCDSGKSYADCCQPCLTRAADAATAEALMRSRYTAFTMANETYLRYSWHPDNCPKIIHLNEDTRWLGLKILKTEAGDEHAQNGEVEFVARSKINGKASRLHENSCFVRFHGRWVYTRAKNEQ